MLCVRFFSERECGDDLLANANGISTYHIRFARTYRIMWGGCVEMEEVSL